MRSNKVLQINGTYYETAMLAIKYQYQFKDCHEIQINNLTLIGNLKCQDNNQVIK